MKKDLVVGVIGGGRIGKLHTRNLVQMNGVTVKKVADIFADKMPTFEAEYGAPLVADFDEIFNDDEIDIVFICTPTDTHVEMIKRAAAKKKHIFCEKPISFSDEETIETYQIVKEAGVKFQIGVNRRFDRNFAQVKEHVANGSIGDIQLLRIDSRDPEAPPLSYVQSSGGLFFDMMIHDFDMARFITGSEVKEVYAVGDALVNSELKGTDVDTAVVTLTFENGCLGVISNSRQAVYGYDQRLEAFGSKGASQAENELVNNVTLSTAEGVQSQKPLHFFLERYNDAYIKEVEEFVAAIHNDTETPVTYEDGIMAQRLAFAANESLKTGKPVQVKKI
ncbi:MULTISPECIES: inositol 2-dehydrogenase [Vagococcus]|uniref:Myo-inositol 2-dehydrogenase 1 n=1 Tax=Vagococcus fluvialis bH819 TaxID=1255619 RepID=A0A1X6WP34_9ENTE|nr:MULTISPECIES: inositol 2-dehydrogenase [Vagococcus]SLM86039.1 Myo-inositol 2-dehydrogenase 1 [Vagococcus fluvialis bH819]HCM88831.1 inositol 2-dehydrogenase [Vagococcus sp.]